jgi:hypothetical protein
MPRVANSRYCQNCGLDFEVRRKITMAILAIAVFLVIAYVLAEPVLRHRPVGWAS